MPASDVPFPDLVRGFLLAAQEHHYETVVVAIPRNGGATVLSSNNGEVAIGKARAQLLVQNGAIERTAMALHSFRFVEKGKMLDPEMDMCSLGACLGAGARGPDGEFVMAGKMPWGELPDVIKEAHRTLAAVVIGNALTGGEASEKKLIV
jgi:hypothetical protein